MKEYANKYFWSLTPTDDSLQLQCFVDSLVNNKKFPIGSRCDVEPSDIIKCEESSLKDIFSIKILENESVKKLKNNDGSSSSTLSNLSYETNNDTSVTYIIHIEIHIFNLCTEQLFRNASQTVSTVRDVIQSILHLPLTRATVGVSYEGLKPSKLCVKMSDDLAVNF